MENLKLILYRLKSAGNIGMIIRTAIAFGVMPENIYIVARLHNKRFFKEMEKRSKAKKVFNNINIVESIEEIKLDGYKKIALEIHPKAVELSESNFENEKLALFIGAEDFGVPKNILDKMDAIFRIKQLSNIVACLNVANATSIALYEIMISKTKSYSGLIAKKRNYVL